MGEPTGPASIEAGIEESLWRNGEDRYQWGQYIERLDGDEWIPLIYDGAEEDVKTMHEQDRLDTMPYRNSRVLRRAIGPWEIQ